MLDVFVLHVLSFGIVFCSSSWLSTLLARHPLFVIVTDSIDAIRIVASFFPLCATKHRNPQTNEHVQISTRTCIFRRLAIVAFLLDVLLRRCSCLAQKVFSTSATHALHTHQEIEKEKIEGKWVKWNGIF